MIPEILQDHLDAHHTLLDGKDLIPVSQVLREDHVLWLSDFDKIK